MSAAMFSASFSIGCRGAMSGPGNAERAVRLPCQPQRPLAVIPFLHAGLFRTRARHASRAGATSEKTRTESLPLPLPRVDAVDAGEEAKRAIPQQARFLGLELVDFARVGEDVP